MKKGWIVFVFIFFAMIKSVLLAGEIPDVSPQIVITPSRIEENLKISPNTILIISGKELQKKGIKTLDEAMRFLPGISIVQNSLGGTTSIFTRGLDSKYTIIMIDGEKIYDPSGINEGETGWIVPAISVEDIDKIEILKGTSTSLYGSNAIGGVINIITKKPKKNKIRIWSEVGSYDTFNKGFSAALGDRNTSALWSFSDVKVEGFSKMKTYPDEDPYHNLNIKGAFSIRKENFKAGIDTLIIKVKQKLDGWNEFEEDRVLHTNFYLQKEFNPFLNLRTQVSYTKTYRDYDYGQSFYKGELLDAGFQDKALVKKWLTMLMGIDWHRERMKTYTLSKKSAISYSPFFNAILDFSRAYLRAGIRYTHHEISGNSLTWDIAGYIFPANFLQLHSTLGTGFVTPSLYQLFSSYGNENLKSEKSFSWDAGTSFFLWKEKVVFDVTYFYNKVKNKIEWDYSTWKYYNIAQIKTSGVEVSLSLRPAKAIHGYLFFNYTSAKNEKGERLSRRPIRKLGGRVKVSMKKANFELEGTYIGPYKDGSHNMGDYFVANFYAYYNLSPHAKIKLKIKNLLDRDYQEIYNYNTPRFSLYGGIEVEW